MQRNQQLARCYGEYQTERVRVLRHTQAEKQAMAKQRQELIGQ